MKNEEIIKALRCVSTAGSSPDCEHCPYWMEESVPAEMRDMVGEDVFHSCDIDRVGLDGADLIERLTARCARYAEEIAVAQEQTRWIPVTERLPDATDVDYVLACVTWKDTHIDYQNAVVMAFVLEEGLVDVEMDCVLDGVTHWMPLPDGPEVVE